MKNFMILVFRPARVGAIWRTSLRASSEHIEDLELPLCTNFTLIGSPEETSSEIQFYSTDFLKYSKMCLNSLSGSPDRFWQIDPAGVLLPEVHLCKLLLICRLRVGTAL